MLVVLSLYAWRALPLTRGDFVVFLDGVLCTLRSGAGLAVRKSVWLSFPKSNCRTKACKVEASRASSPAALLVYSAPSVVLLAAVATPVMLRAISWLPLATSLTLRLISLVVAVCSSTAVAMVFWMSLIWAMIWLISVMPSIAPLVSAWMASILRLISSVALAVSLANSFTSLATTAKPLPASPARAASMVAFNARRWVCAAIVVMTLITWPISRLLSPSLLTFWLAASATFTPLPATFAASRALVEISRMLTVI